MPWRKYSRTIQCTFVVLLFAVSGAILIVIIKAASPHAAIEAENGTYAGRATSQGDSTASGQEYLKYGPEQIQPGTVMTETFDFTDGTLANGWQKGEGPMIRIAGGKGSTLTSTLMHRAYKSHGLDVGGEWEIEFDTSAPLDIGAGGVTVGLINPADGTGYAVFAGNAVHIQRYNTGGTHDNVTNDGRTGEGSGRQLANHVLFTHGANGDMKVYLDGVLWSYFTDTQRVAGSVVFMTLQNSGSPATETTIDNLVVRGD